MKKKKTKSANSNLKSNDQILKLSRKKFLNDVNIKYPNISDFSSLLSTRQEVTRLLHYNEIYQKLLNKPGVIMEFGCRYGSVLSLLCKFRSIYEPYNYSRKIIGFDTFQGFENTLTRYEKSRGWSKGDYGVHKKFETVLEKILLMDEQLAPLSKIKKFELVKGDAGQLIKPYLKKNPQTIIGMAIFDMDVFKPTKEVIKTIKDRLYKGSILVFDELNHPKFPGETLALLETMGIRNLKLNSFHGATFSAWAILD